MFSFQKGNHTEERELLALRRDKRMLKLVLNALQFMIIARESFIEMAENEIGIDVKKWLAPKCGKL